MNDDPEKFVFFGDESSQTKWRFAAAGGILMPVKAAIDLRESVREIKLQAGIGSEIKWSGLKAARLGAHIAVVDKFFAKLHAGEAEFHCLFADFGLFDHRRGTQAAGKAESVGRLLYQLALHRACKPRGAAEVHLRYDEGDSTRLMPAMRRALNRAANRNGWGNPIASIQLRDSQESELLQVNDLILGALTSNRNSRHLLPGAAAHKTKLMQHVMSQAGLVRADQDARRIFGRVSLWNFRAEMKKAA